MQCEGRGRACCLLGVEGQIDVGNAQPLQLGWKGRHSGPVKLRVLRF